MKLKTSLITCGVVCCCDAQDAWKDALKNKRKTTTTGEEETELTAGDSPAETSNRLLDEILQLNVLIF